MGTHLGLGSLSSDLSLLHQNDRCLISFVFPICKGEDKGAETQLFSKSSWSPRLSLRKSLQPRLRSQGPEPWGCGGKLTPAEGTGGLPGRPAQGHSTSGRKSPPSVGKVLGVILAAFPINIAFFSLPLLVSPYEPMDKAET